MKLWSALWIPILAGCGFGRSFVAPDKDELVPGVTTEEQVRTRMGPPILVDSLVLDGNSYAQWTYTYGSRSSSSAHVAGTMPLRGMNILFRSGILTGYNAWSSYKESSTDFDEGKVESLSKGSMTRGDVVALLGPPSGVYAHPLVKSPTQAGLTYTYMHLTKGRTYTKHLLVVLDAQDRVVDVQYNAQGSR